jgi:hypothetical protein
MFLLERLESQIATSPGLRAKALVDRDAALDLIDQLRAAIPEEVQAAKRINSEGERILEQSTDEASRILSRAQEQAAFLISERGLTEEAEAEGRRIVAAALSVADETRAGADAYAVQVLLALETEAEKALAGIRKGIDVLDDRRAQLRVAPSAEIEATATESTTDATNGAGHEMGEESEAASPVR